MKKVLTCGVASLALATIPVLSVFAEAPQSGNSETGYFVGSKNTTVGDVDETIYSVDITWGDMAFDWKYDETKNTYDFKPHFGCEGYTASSADDSFLNAALNGGQLYSDNTCSTLQTEALVSGRTYYQKSEVGGRISVKDMSENGKVKAYAGFVAADDYNWVVGHIAGTYTQVLGSDEINYGEDLADGLLRTRGGNVGNRAYDGWLHLENSDRQVFRDSISTSDRIGTIILSIEPDMTPISD